MKRVFPLLTILISTFSFSLAANASSSFSNSSSNTTVSLADTAAVDSLHKLAKQHYSSDIDKAIKYSGKAIEVSKACNSDKKLAKSQLLFGMLLNEKGTYTEAIKYFDSCLVYYEELQDTNKCGKVNFHISSSYLKMGVYDKSMTHILTAQNYFDQTDNLKGISMCLNTIGGINMYQKNFGSALKYFQEKLAIDKEQNDGNGISYTYQNLGIIYKDLQEYDSALSCYNKALKYLEENKQIYYAAEVYNNIGNVYRRLNKFDIALDYYEKALIIKEKRGNPKLIASTLNNMAMVYNEKMMYAKAIDIALRSLKLVDTLGVKVEKLYALESLASSYESTGNFKKAYHYQTKYHEVKDSLFDKEKHKQIKALETQYQTEQKEHEIAKLNQENLENELTIKNEKLKRSSTIIILIAVIFVASALLLILTIKAKKKKLAAEKREQDLMEKAKNEIEEIHKNKNREKLESLDREMKNVSQEIHDGILSDLSGVQLILNTKNGSTQNPKVEKASHYLKTSIEKLRNISHQLNTPEFEYNTLEMVVENYLEQFKDSNISISFKNSLNMEIESLMQVAIYRIIQEAVKNTLKHSNANICNISLEKVNNEIHLHIKDNGAKINISKPGIGLANMHDRVRSFNGNMLTKQSNGFEIDINLPLIKN